MAQCYTPQLRNSANQPIGKALIAMSTGTAATFGLTNNTVLLPTSDGLLSDITIKLITTTETTAITARDWGGSTIAAASLLLLDATTGNEVTSSAALASGTYILPHDKGAGLIRELVFTKSAAVNSGTVAVFAMYDQNANL